MSNSVIRTTLEKKMHRKVPRNIVLKAVQKQIPAPTMQSSCIWMTRKTIGSELPAPRVLRLPMRMWRRLCEPPSMENVFSSATMMLSIIRP